VVRIGFDKDLDGWRPELGQDRQVRPAAIEDREYNDATTTATSSSKSAPPLVAAKITEFLKATDRFAKTIVFCENIDHAERMRQALVNANPDLAAANSGT
jgi:type I restriction enzyme R subunit